MGAEKLNFGGLFRLGNTFETNLINALKDTYNEKDIETKQYNIQKIIEGVENFSRLIQKGDYREEGYGEIFVTYFKSFTVPIVFEDSRTKKRDNGSGCLLRLDRDFLITNAHVVNGALKAEFILIGKIEVENLKEKIVSIDEDLDLAVIDLSDGVNEELEQSGKMFFKPKSWPSSNCEKDDLVYICGFPGVFREDEELFSTIYFAAIHERIMDVTDRRYISEFTREKWRKALGVKEIVELERLGGLSGGPVFKCRDDLIELVGFTYEDGGGFFDGIKIIKSNFIGTNGELLKG